MSGSAITPPASAVSRSDSAVFITSLCLSASPGRPKGLPKGNLSNTARGGLTASTTSRIAASVTVAIPCSSNTRATKLAVC
ncbi:MAG: hypothetical protein K0Q77_454 [Anaerosporomusa subterranea]|nr:hypothetical protein [Anaerosporomusa subterranea]